MVYPHTEMVHTKDFSFGSVVVNVVLSTDLLFSCCDQQVYAYGVVNCFKS